MKSTTDTFLHIFGIVWAAAVILTCANFLLEHNRESDEEGEEAS